MSTVEAPAAAASAGPSPFVRQSSGLVKTGTPFRTAAMVIFNDLTKLPLFNHVKP